MPARKWAPWDVALNALPMERGEAGDWGQGDILFLGGGDNGRGQRVLRGLLQGGGHAEELRLGGIAQRMRSVTLGLPSVRGARFVQNHGVDGVEGLQGLGRFDEDTMFGPPCRCPPWMATGVGQAQGTGTGDHQHSHGRR